MPVAITIRHVSEGARDALAARAAARGQSLQQYLKAMLEEAAVRPTADEVIARARERAAASGVVLDTDEMLHDLQADRR